MKDFEIKNGILIKYYGTDTDVVIPDGVKSIGEWVFEGCRSLTSIVIPDGITSVGNSAFCGCKSLKSLTIPKSVTSIGTRAFCGCISLENITISESVTSIGDGVFARCERLESITIPDDVKSIGNCAFAWCVNLTSVTIPDSVTSIGVGAFDYCYNLKIYKNRYFKATDGNMRCRGFQYELGKTYKTDKAELCKCGFHACRFPLDVFNYYDGKLGKDVRLFEVELKGITDESNEDSKCVGTEITFLKELTISELAKLASDRGVEK